MLYGYVSAVLTGFLLTAIPNWTGRLPLQGNPLLVLTIVWLAGRFAVLFSASIGWLPTALIDTSFLLLVLAAVIRELSAGRNWRNLKIAVLVALFAALARVAAAAAPFSADLLMPVTGLTWTAGFLGFAVAYAPVLCRPAPRPAAA